MKINSCYIFIILVFVLSIYFIVIPCNKKIEEGFIPHDIYMPHVKKIHESFRLYTTQQVNKMTKHVHHFLRNWYIIY